MEREDDEGGREDAGGAGNSGEQVRSDHREERRPQSALTAVSPLCLQTRAAFMSVGSDPFLKLLNVAFSLQTDKLARRCTIRRGREGGERREGAETRRNVAQIKRHTMTFISLQTELKRLQVIN
ncbi:uncharacterized protein V6R79_010464 [Siganus canaliculatus]